MPPSYVEHRGVGRRRHDGRLARPRRLVRPDRRAGPPRRPGSRSAACSSRPAPVRSSSRTRRSSGPAARCSRACSSGAARSSAPGVTLTGTSRLYDLVRGRVIDGTDGAAAGRARRRRGRARAPGRSRATSPRRTGCRVATALLVKDRDAGTRARVALEDGAPMSLDRSSGPIGRAAAAPPAPQRDPAVGPPRRRRARRPRRPGSARRCYVYDLDVVDRQVDGAAGGPAAGRRPRLRGQGQPGAGDRRPPRAARARRRRGVGRRAGDGPPRRHRPGAGS